jgi:phage-related minor tail protein
MTPEIPDFGEDLAGATDPLRDALRDLEGLADGFGRAMTTAFKRSVVDGKRLEDVLKSLALSMSGKALDAALAPIAQGLGGFVEGLFGGLSAARGFSRGGTLGPMVTPFAQGGVVATPSYFPMRGGLGLMGEAGPEAILPLARGPDGKLGVRAGGGGGTSVVFNVTTRDAESFRRAEAELTAMLARAVARGHRGL